MRGKRPYTLVLGGGGAKGAYQIGAWKALRELGIRWNSIIGASVGSINGALIAQGDFALAEEIWRTMTPRDIVEIPETMVTEGRIRWKFDSMDEFFEFNKSVITHKGLDTSPLRGLIDRFLDEEAIRSTGLDFGLVTINLSSLKPTRLFLQDIPRGQLGDFIMASAGLPIFEAAKIKGVQYADGGLYDNVPAKTARERGYRRLLILDLMGLGHNRPFDAAETDTVWVRLTKPIGGTLDFAPRSISELMTAGKLDTLRVFGRVTGHWYYLEPKSRWFDQWKRRLMDRSDLVADVCKTFGLEFKDQGMTAFLRVILPKEFDIVADPYAILLETTALSLGIPQLAEYGYKELYDKILVASKTRAKPGSPRSHWWRTLMRDLLPESERQITPRHYAKRLAEELAVEPSAGGGRGGQHESTLPAKIFFYLDRKTGTG